MPRKNYLKRKGMSNFILYFAGAGSKQAQEEIKKLQCNQLLSYGIARGEIYKWVEFKRNNPDYKGKLFIDSGAHSISTGAITIDKDTYLEDYIKFINETGDAVDIFCQLDDIPEGPTVDRDTFKNSWENYLYMVTKVKVEYRDKLVPVFHFNEDFKGLDTILEHVHEDTKQHIPYICLAPRFGNYGVRYAWLEEAFKHIRQSSNPNVKTHVLGCTILRLLEEFPITSADSATWAISSAFGSVRIGDMSIPISEQTENKSTNLANKSVAQREAVEAVAKEHGLTMEELRKEPYKRQIMTIREMKKWEDNYKCRYQGVVKTELW